jgi:hypothetical protein
MAYEGGHFTEEDIVWFVSAPVDEQARNPEPLNKAIKHLLRCEGDCDKRYCEGIDRYMSQSELEEES